MNANYPIIRRRIRGIELVRSARGFSKAELKEAGFSNISFARKKGISVDELRKTTVPENVEKLKSIASEFSNTKRNKSNSTKEKDQKIYTVVNNKPNEAAIKEK
jgi:ribosomal protein L13E